MVSGENHPELTAYSPTTIPATTDNGVDNIVGVFTAASLNPSIANSNIMSCQNTWIFASSARFINASQPGSFSGYSISAIHIGVSISVSTDIINLDILI